MPRARIKTTTKINPNWMEYEQSVARCHLYNYGVIFLDEYGCPYDNEFILEDLYARYQKRSGK